MHQPGVAVEVEYDGRVLCEDGCPLAVCQTVGVVYMGDELEQVHHVDAADFEIREVLEQEIDGCGYKEKGNIDTPLELAIRNQTDRFSLAMDVTATLSLGDPLEPARKATAQMLQERERTFSLPQPFYSDERLFDIDMQEIFQKEWLIAGMTCEIPTKGNYITLQIGKNPIIVIRGADGVVHAFHNVCRHRGSRLCTSDKGKVAKLVCHYHQWTYELDGRLLFAGTEMGADFDMKQYGLKPVNVKTAGGYIFISLAENPPAIDDFLSTLNHYMEPYDMENTKVAIQTTLFEKANWKLVLENNRECYHCNASHPELLKTLLEWDDVTDPRADQAFKDHVAASAADSSTSSPLLPALKKSSRTAAPSHQ